MKSWQRLLIEFCVGGACSAVVVSVVMSFYMTGGIFGAKWWEVMAAVGTVGALFVAIQAPQKIYEKNRKFQELNHIQELLALQQVMHDVANRVFDIVRGGGNLNGLLVKVTLLTSKEDVKHQASKILMQLDILSVLMGRYIRSFESLSWDVYPKSKLASEIISFINIMKLFDYHIEGMRGYFSKVNSVAYDFYQFEELKCQAKKLNSVLLSVHEKIGVGDYAGPAYESAFKYRRKISDS